MEEDGESKGQGGKIRSERCNGEEERKETKRERNREREERGR